MYSVKAKLACVGLGVSGVRTPLGVELSDMIYRTFIDTSGLISRRSAV